MHLYGKLVYQLLHPAVTMSVGRSPFRVQSERKNFHKSIYSQEVMWTGVGKRHCVSGLRQPEGFNRPRRKKILQVLSEHFEFRG